MRLLVSVRNETEASAALAGGAGIIDAKDPAAGSLGPVAPDVLARIRDVVPASVGLSAALGDAADQDGVARALGTVAVRLDYLKLGFHGVSDRGRLHQLLAEADRIARSLPGAPALIAVAYADWERTESLPPAELARLVADLRVGGLLIDTAVKDGRTLFDLCGVEELAELGSRLSGGGCLLALGGVLGAADIPRAHAVGAAVFGVRTAACEGGRNGAISAARVRRLAEATREACAGV